MRIAVVMDDELVNAAYRAVVPFEALAARGHDVSWHPARHGYDVAKLSACDVVYIHRQFDGPTQRMAKAVRERGVGVWWDNDDDIRALPRGAPGYREIGGMRGERIFAGMVRMMRLADLVSSPSAVLAERYRALGIDPVVVIGNHVPDAFARARRERRGGRLVIGWLAALEHRLDAEALGLRSVLERTCERHRDVQIVSIGVDLNLRVRDGAYRHVPHVPFEEVGEAVAEFDIGIAPIVDNAFNQARSDVKIKEYAAAGTPWLASPVGPYLELGERQGGRLVGDDGWGPELERLIERRWARRRLARRAARWGRGQTIGANVRAWEEAAEEVRARARRRRLAPSSAAVAGA